MAYDKALIAGKLRRWEKYLIGFRLPAWEDIPDFGLYMEQVVDLLKRYLDYMPPELKEEDVVTSSAINNYVRRGIMPGPRKKKYYRLHVAYLIMICALKQSLNMVMIMSLLPQGQEEEEVRRAYDSFVQRHALSARFFVDQVRMVSSAILDHADTTEMAVNTTEELITSAAIVAGFSRLLAEKLLLLDGKDLETGGSIEIRTPTPGIDQVRMHKSILDAGRRGFSGCAVCTARRFSEPRGVYVPSLLFMEQAGQPERI